MKAIYNITGEIVDIEDMSIVTYKSSEGTWVKTLIKNFTFIDAEKDYYTKLEHQAAIAAMQAQMAPNCLDSPEGVACTAYAYAHALVEKMKGKEEK